MKELIQQLRVAAAYSREQSGCVEWNGYFAELDEEAADWGIDNSDQLVASVKYAGYHANLALNLEQAANALQRLTCETCDGTGLVKFCPDPTDSNCGGCEEAPCPECGVQQ